jgi:putative ABC transport system permease protein
MLTFGVTYNATRIALSERARELATLRVLGLGRGEVSYILLGEIGFLAALGLPAGCAFGVLLTTTIASSFETELFRVPMVIEGATFGGSMLIACFSAVVSAALVRRRLDRLDLISVLKTRE